MKKTLIRLAVIIVLVIISIFLYVNGQEHKVFVENKTIEINGTEYTKLPMIKVKTTDKNLSVRAGRRSVFYAKGLSASVELSYKDEKEKDIKVTKSFNLPLNKDIILNIPALLTDNSQSVIVYIKK